MSNRNSIKAIETQYKGYLFRSRLEARWAVYFDALKLKWEYEKQGFDLGGDLYLPDFWLPEIQWWAEVKPEKLSLHELLLVEKLVTATDCSCIALVGTPSCHPYWYCTTDRAYGEPDNFSQLAPGYNGDWRDRLLWCDCMVSNYEGRGMPYVGTGWDENNPARADEFEDFFDDVTQAVRAARSARFEHGHSGRVL